MRTKPTTKIAMKQAPTHELTPDKTAPRCSAAARIPSTAFAPHGFAIPNAAPPASVKKESASGQKLTAWLALLLIMLSLSFQASAASVIDPTGASYTSISASSEFNGSYTAANLFSFNVASAAIGAVLPDGVEWAVTGPPVTNGYVAFDLGTAYTVSSLYYAQRAGGPAQEMMNIAQIWTSQTTPFDPNNPPATAPVVMVGLTNVSGRVWSEYVFTNSFLGRYFLVNFIQTNGAGYAPGGDEMRLGGALPNVIAPFFTQMPASRTLYAGVTARFNVAGADGNTAPLTYQWKKGAAVLNDGARVSGSTTPNLQITSITSGDVGSYSCTVTNIAGSTNSDAATLAVVTAPTTGVGATVMSNSPYAYWRLDESTGATVAPDYAGGFDAAYGAGSLLGNPGPRSPTFPGFSSGNVALGTTLGDVTSVVTVPPLNMDTNTVTMMAWINPAVSQDPYSSLIVWRDGGGAAYGLLAYGGKLAWIWNNVGWYEDSGLVIPQNQWSLAVMVITPTNTTLYLGANGSLGTYVSPNGNPNATFNSNLLIGCDNGSRVFNGFIDDVAFFSHSLTAQQIQSIYAAGVGQVPVFISEQPVSRTIYAGGMAHFSAGGGGVPPPQYYWKKGTTFLTDGGNISGAHTAALTIANVSASDVATYSCVVSNLLGSLPSTAATLTVLPVPTVGYDWAVLSYKPLAYWQLNEALGATNTPDYWGGFDGTPLPTAVLGAVGPRPTDFPGFTSTNTALQTAFADGNSSIAVPALNLNADTATILMWIYPNSSQVGYCSLFANRSGGFMALNYLSDGATLSYQWNSFGWDSGILIPSSQWSLIGMVITPTNTTVYLGTGGVLTNNTQVINNPALSFAGTSYIGSDSGNNTRVFDGVIDDVAFFNRSLSASDVAVLYGAGLGQLPPPTTLNWSVSGANLVLTWLGPWTLIQSDNGNGPWSPATGITSGTSIPMTAVKKFYRLQH